MRAISTRHLTKHYGKTVGIEALDLAVEEGEIFGFIGQNGAGKSTTIKLLLNMIFPSDGTAYIFGENVTNCSIQLKREIGYVPADVRFYPELSARELLKITTDFAKDKTCLDIAELAEQLDLKLDCPFGTLSTGNKKKVAIATALVTRPRLIILDEPTAGLDPLMQKKLFELLHNCNRSGATIFVSSHNLNEIETYCSSAAFIHEGKIVKLRQLGDSRPCAKIVTIKAPALQKYVFEKIGGKMLDVEPTYLKFSYQGALDELTSVITTLHPTDLIIENASLEDEFMEFYRNPPVLEDELKVHNANVISS